MSESSVMISHYDGNVSQHHGKSLDQPQVSFTRQLWQRNMPADREMASPASTMPRVSIGSSVASETSLAVRSASVASIRSHTLGPNSPHTPIRSSISATLSPPAPSPLKRPHEQLDDPRQTTSSSPKSAVQGPSFPCLCQPEPKIPRPRNAFILYRQHHNGSVIDTYPHLSNPDISKIIGELWRNESEEEKQKWKQFAEEDKVQHAQKYPTYRYQPKRTNKNGDGSPGPWTDSQTCPKCHGRKAGQPVASAHLPQKSQGETIAPDAVLVPRRSNNITLPPPRPSATLPSTRYLPLQNLSLASPSASAHYVSPGREGFSPLDGRLSPKRRRVDLHHPVNQAQTPSTTGPRDPHYTLPPMPHPQSTGPQHMRRISLPPASDLLATSSHGRIGMPPPTRHLARPPPPPQRNANLLARRTPPRSDLSLNLPPPPLPTSKPPVMIGPQTARHGPVVMAQPPPDADGRVRVDNEELKLLQHKMATLRQLLTPLPLPGAGPSGSRTDGDRIGSSGSSDGAGRKRGAIIAVEGDSPSAARELADWLGKAMRGQGDVTVVDGPRVPERSGDDVKVEQLLNVVGSWHERGRNLVEDLCEVAQPGEDKEMVDVVAGRKDSGSGSAVGEDAGTETTGDGATEGEIDEPVKSGRLLVLRGYVLTATNLFAARIPITGNYDPKGHWEWTACMWRGMVAPDLVVYVKDGAGQEGLDVSGCEVFEKESLVLVNRCRNNIEKTGVEGVHAGALRRLGFEVGEWLRSFS